MKPITWVGLDVHTAAPIQVARMGSSEVIEEWELPFERKAIERLAQRLARDAGGGEVHCCYEAGPAGFTVKRWMEGAAEGVFCDVVAPSLIPRKPGDQVKTDRRDARKLARLHRIRELTAVYPPSPDEEAVRGVVRQRDQTREDLHRARQRLKSFLQLRGMVFAGHAWTKRFEAWLSKLSFEAALDKDSFVELRTEVHHHQSRLDRLDSRIDEISKTGFYAERVQQMRCFRGIDTLTAMGIVTTLHNPERFRTPEAMMSYVGLTPSESSSGTRERRGPITRQGDKLLRRLLIEAANNQASKPRNNPRLIACRKNQPPEIVDLAEKAALRLHKRYWHLKLTGRLHNVAVVAIARELVGFLWAMLQLETTRPPSAGAAH